MGNLITLGLIISIILFPFPKFVIRHAFDMLKYGAIDIYYYFKHKEYNRCPYFGRVEIVSAYRNKVFGSGKTPDITVCLSGMPRKKPLLRSTFTSFRT